MFETAINDSETVDVKLCFEAALLQSSVDSEDIEAVLVYLEACISSFVKSGEYGIRDTTNDIINIRTMIPPTNIEHWQNGTTENV